MVTDKVERQTNLGEYLPNMTDCVLMKSILDLLIFASIANNLILKQKNFSGKRIKKLIIQVTRLPRRMYICNLMF